MAVVVVLFHDVGRSMLQVDKIIPSIGNSGVVTDSIISQPTRAKPLHQDSAREDGILHRS